MSHSLTACIDGHDYSYSVNAEDGTYCFEVGGRSYRFRQWTWGEKNRVTDAATVTDSATGRLRIDVARFNELLLAATMIHADSVDTITPDALRGLNPVLGDTLLGIAYWVNELADDEKKASPPPYAAAMATAT